MLQAVLHYGFHFLAPLAIALIWYKPKWLFAYGIMVSGMLIDLDHLLAIPIFETGRCSINFHPLHCYWAIIAYVLLLFPKQTRLIGLGLAVHILADGLDCLMMAY